MTFATATAALLLLLGPLAPGGAPADRATDRVLADVPMRGRYASDVFLPGLPGIGIFDPAAGLDPIDETRLIQLVYDAFSRYSATEDGGRARFTFHAFRTVYRDDFSTVAYYPDLVTPAPDWRLRTVRFARYENDVLQGVQYRAEWVPSDPVEQTGADELLGRSVLELIDLIAADLPHWRRAVALTSVDLTADFADRSERYRAGALWYLAEDGALRLVLVDNVAREAPLAVAETDPPLFGAAVEGILPSEPLAESSGTSSPICTQQTWPSVSSRPEDRPEVEAGGRQRPALLAEFDCSCSASCLSRCEATVLDGACPDQASITGAEPTRHATTLVDEHDRTSAGGQARGAGCEAKMACAFQTCPAFSCGGVKIELRAEAGGLSFSAPIQAAGVEKRSWTHRCGSCTQASSP